MKISCLMLPVLFGISLHTVAQGNTAATRIRYTIENSLKKTIEKKELNENMGVFTIQWMEDGKEAGIPRSGKEMPCMVACTRINDTVRIITMGFMGMTTGIAIDLYKDSARAIHYVASKDRSHRSFKKNSSDTAYQFGPDAPAKSFKLILANAPAPGGPVEGYIEFESVEFYQKGASGDIKRAYNIKGYFRAREL